MHRKIGELPWQLTDADFKDVEVAHGQTAVILDQRLSGPHLRGPPLREQVGHVLTDVPRRADCALEKVCEFKEGAGGLLAAGGVRSSHRAGSPESAPKTQLKGQT